MNKILYIIPGMGQTCNLVRYKKLAQIAESRGYKVFTINPDWTKPISEQIFKVEKDAVIFGFSMGAVLAYLVARKYECKKIILASITPTHEQDYDEVEEFLSTKMDKNLARAVAADMCGIKMDYKKLNTEFITLAGEEEKVKADVIIPKTSHYLSTKYLDKIKEVL